MYEDVEKTEEIDSKITINSDTTEIRVKFKNATIKEKIGKIYHRQIVDEYKLYMYNKEKSEWGELDNTSFYQRYFTFSCISGKW